MSTDNLHLLVLDSFPRFTVWKISICFYSRFHWMRIHDFSLFLENKVTLVNRIESLQAIQPNIMFIQPMNQIRLKISSVFLLHISIDFNCLVFHSNWWTPVWMGIIYPTMNIVPSSDALSSRVRLRFPDIHVVRKMIGANQCRANRYRSVDWDSCSLNTEKTISIGLYFKP